MEKSVFFPLKIPKHLEKFQKIGVGNAKCHKIATNTGHTAQNDGQTAQNDGRTAQCIQITYNKFRFTDELIRQINQPVTSS